MRPTISCKENDTWFYLRDYFSPSPLYNVEKKFDLTIHLCFVSPTLLVGGGGNDLVVSMMFARDCRLAASIMLSQQYHDFGHLTQ